MGGNYGKSVYNQLMDVMARLDPMEAEHKSDRKEIATLNAEVKSLQKENSRLKTELDTVISAALPPVALLSALMLAAKKYVLSVVSSKPANHPFTSCPSTRPVPVFP